MRRAPLPIALAALALVAGCGNDRTLPPSSDGPARPTGRPVAEFRSAGVRLPLPEGWLRSEGPSPLLVTTSSARATLAVWRFPRAEPLPQDALALEDARRTLLAAAKARDPSLRDARARVRTVDGRPAIDVRARGRVDGRPRVLRSVHVYAFGAEVVLDGYAPESEFGLLDREVLGPAVQGLRLRDP